MSKNDIKETIIIKGHNHLFGRIIKEVSGKGYTNHVHLTVAADKAQHLKGIIKLSPADTIFFFSRAVWGLISFVSFVIYRPTCNYSII